MKPETKEKIIAEIHRISEMDPYEGPLAGVIVPKEIILSLKFISKYDDEPVITIETKIITGE